jgi:hypothetical protein
MDIVITAWALDSYLDLKHTHVFTDPEYKGTIRPDVMLLKTYPQLKVLVHCHRWQRQQDTRWLQNEVAPGGSRKSANEATHRFICRISFV